MAGTIKRIPEYAFPRRLPKIELSPDAALRCVLDHSGMELLDYFAAKAMQGQLANPLLLDRHGLEPQGVAAAAFDFAEAMMQEREERRRRG